MRPDERRILLALARDAIERHLGLSPSTPAEAPPLPSSGPLREPGAAFVTIHMHGALRGCIGTFARSEPLAETVREIAVAAATRDPRFPAVRPEEVPELTLDISVLSPLRPATPDQIEVGRHGLQVARGGARGVLLPQVATEHGWDRERFLAETCRKAGLPRNAWREPRTKIEAFEAEVFGEENDPT